MGVILDMPFDESPSSLIASDYGPYLKHADVHGATFHSGREGWCIHFDGGSYAHVRMTTLDLTGNFTVLFWWKSKVISPYAMPEKIRFLFAFEDESIEELTYDIILDTWEHFAIVKDGLLARVYKDGELIGSVEFPGHPVEWAVWQTRDGSETFPYELPMTFGVGTDSPYSMGDMDRLLIYDEALTEDEIKDRMKREKRRFFWEIDNRNFLDWGVYVEASNGLIDALQLKESNEVDWPNEHGRIVDLKRPRFEPREIELSCWMFAEGMLDFTMKIDDFLKQFTQPKKYLDSTPGFVGRYSEPGYHRLACRIDKYKPLVWEVYMPKGTAMNKRWHNEEMYGTFTLKLVDNNPVRRVLRFVVNESGPMVYVCMKATSVFNIFWGDGHVLWDVFPEIEETYWHKYDKPGIYEIIIAGEPDDIIFFMSNATIIWNKL